MRNQAHTGSAMPSTTTDAKAARADAKSARADHGAELAAGLLARLFRRLPFKFTVRLWNGTALQVGALNLAGGESQFTLVFRDPSVVYSAVLGRDPLRIAESYFRGEMDIEGDFFAALGLRNHLDDLSMSVGEKAAAAVTALRLRGRAAATLSSGRTIKAQPKLENREAVQFHYDVSNEFYALW